MLNSRDIAALNRARKVLKRLEDAAWSEALSHFDPYAPVTAWDLGRLSDAASVADDAIFHVLGTARTNCKVSMTDAQMFGSDAVPTNGASPAETTDPLTAATPAPVPDAQEGDPAGPRVVQFERAKREQP